MCGRRRSDERELLPFFQNFSFNDARSIVDIEDIALKTMAEKSGTNTRRAREEWHTPSALAMIIIAILQVCTWADQCRLLHPLFSKGPVEDAMHGALLVGSLALAVFQMTTRRRASERRWRIALVVLGLWSISSEALVRMLAIYVMKQGSTRGLLISSVALQGVPMLVIAWSGCPISYHMAVRQPMLTASRFRH